MRSPSTLFAASIVLAVVAFAGRSDASGPAPRLLVDWRSLARGLEGLRSDPSAARPLGGGSQAALTDSEPTEDARWIASPTAVLSLVARDWEGASHVAGAPLSSSDAIRVSKSSRMLVGRVAADVGRLAPFAHVGFGQWRCPDPHVIAGATPYAAQVGVGIEVSIVEGCNLALEYDWTAMYLESHSAEAMAARYLGWGEAFAAVRWNFETSFFAAPAHR
jgi:hypothetical protein